jgi:hypothetical protein
VIGAAAAAAEAVGPNAAAEQELIGVLKEFRERINLSFGLAVEVQNKHNTAVFGGSYTEDGKKDPKLLK